MNIQRSQRKNSWLLLEKSEIRFRKETKQRIKEGQIFRRSLATLELWKYVAAKVIQGGLLFLTIPANFIKFERKVHLDEIY